MGWAGLDGAGLDALSADSVPEASAVTMGSALDLSVQIKIHTYGNTYIGTANTYGNTLGLLIR